MSNIVEIEPSPNIFQRIRSIMSELDYIEKGDKMVNGQYRFVSHDQVTAKIHPLLVKYGVVVIPSIREMTQEGNRTVAKIAIGFINTDRPEDQFLVDYVAYGIDSGDKGPGKAISYAMKYALLKTFCLETGDDPDNDANAKFEPPRCLEFDAMLPELTDKEKAKLEKFLQYSSETMQKHVEEVKREAIKRMPDFMNAFAKWKAK